MATNPPTGDGHRNGAVRDRSQTHRVLVVWSTHAYQVRI